MKLLDKFFQDADKKQAISWSFFDFANSGYALLIGTFVFPIFYKEVIAGVEKGDFYWGLIISLSILIGGLLTPIIGAMADHDSRKKTKLILFSLLCIFGTAMLYFSGPNTLILSSIIFIFTHICFEISTTLYDSFLNQVSTAQTVGRISGLGWGFGYIGGVVAMLSLTPFFEDGYAGDLMNNYKLTFPLTALFFLIFALPSFFYLKENKSLLTKIKFWVLAKTGLQKVISTIKTLKNYKNIAWFLLAFFLLNDALITLFTFMPIYARTTFEMSFTEIMSLLLIVQIAGFPAATIFGYISDKKGSKKILLSTIIIWGIIIIMLASATSKEIFYAIALLTALVIGSSQAIARSWLNKMVPEEKRFEFFGFNGFASKMAATTGPLLFGTISVLTGNQRLAILALLPFFIAAFVIFSKIKEDNA